MYCQCEEASNRRKRSIVYRVIVMASMEIFLCAFPHLSVSLSIGFFSQEVNINKSLLALAPIQGHSSPSWVLLPLVLAHCLVYGTQLTTVLEKLLILLMFFFLCL